jgi:phosphoglycerol transferase MdoB-like AlkP superfamily enzyme
MTVAASGVDTRGMAPTVRSFCWVGTLIVAAFVLRLPLFLVPFSSGDEATYSALARALLDGQTMYVGAVDHKPPLMAFTYAAVYLFAGFGGIHAVHALSVLVVALTGVLLRRVAEQMGMAGSDARAAAFAWIVFSSIGPAGDALAANGEIFMLLPSVGAVALVARSSTGEGEARSSIARWLGAGLLAGVASLYKYQATTILVPLALLAVTPVLGVRTVVTRLALLGWGFCLPLVALVGWYAHLGQLDALHRWAWTYPLLYANSLPPAQALRNLLVGLLAWSATGVGLLLAAARGLRAARALVSSRGMVAIAAWVAGGAVAVSAGGRFTLHYFLQLLPPLCLLAAPALSMAAARPGRWRRTLVATTALPLAIFLLSNVLGQPTRPSLRRHTRVYQEVGRYLDAVAAASDSVFVWGNSPEIYYFSRRVMGTRFPFCNYHTGKIWGTAADREGAPVPPAQVYEPAWQALLEDLERRKPRWIVDAAAGGLDRWTGHDISRYPRLLAVINGAYRRHATVAGVIIYRLHADPPDAGRRETIDPTYSIVLRPRTLVGLDPIDDRFDLDVLRREPLPSVTGYHVTLTIRSGATLVTSRSTFCRASPAGGASCGMAPVVPLWDTLRLGRLRSVIPAWRYGGFALEAVVRENSAVGRPVYRLLQDDVLLGISWEGFLDWVWLPTVLAGLAVTGLVLLIDSRRASASRARLVSVEISGIVLVVASAAFSRWAVLLLAPLALIWLALPAARRGRIAAAVPSPRSTWAGARSPATWSPAIMTVVLTAWLLFWHQSQIAIHGFNLNDFSAHLRGLGALYLGISMVFSALIHAAMWSRPPGRARVLVATAAYGVLGLSAIARAIDWGTFYYSAGHVDDDFWTHLFYAQHLGFASRGATWWPIAGLSVALAAFAGLLRLSGRFADLASWTGEAPRRKAGAILAANALAAYLIVASAHMVWMVAAAAPGRDVSPSVREAFSGVPEYKVFVSLASRALRRQPERPPLDPAFVAKLERAGLRLNSLDPEYPLMKRSIYLDPAEAARAGPRVAPGTNLIVILAESLSSALIDDRVHGVEGLTPNFADFARSAFAFRNLYSSDFPTVKGQLATLASFAFDHRGLSTTSESGNPLKSRFLFLSDVLRDRGYTTIHLQADFGSFANTKAILARHHYDRFLSAEDRELTTAAARPLTKTWGVYDEDLFRAMNRMLASGSVRAPFLITAATTDMHFPYTVAVRHPGASGNDLLDAVHTEDRAFGVFWREFQRSRWADNTLILLTADHALVRQVVRRGGTDPRVSDFDYVTGLLYVPGGDRWAGDGTDTVCTQLDLLPTILDVMGIDLPNPFLGLSIFSDRARYPLALGREIPLDRLPPATRAVADAIGWTNEDQDRYMRLLRYLATADRIMP